MSEVIINQRIFDTTIDLILVTDQQGNFLRISPSSFDILGYHPSEMIGHSALDFIQHADLKNTRAEMRMIRRGKVMRHFPCRYIHKNGHDVLLRWTGVWDDTTNQHFFIGRDITAFREAQRIAEQLSDMENMLVNIDRDVKAIKVGYWYRLGDLYITDVLMTLGSLLIAWMLLYTPIDFPFLISFGRKTNSLWALFMLTVGLIKVWGIIGISLPPYQKYNTNLRCIGHAMAGMFWLLISASLFVNRGDLLLGTMSAITALRSMWFAVRMWSKHA